MCCFAEIVSGLNPPLPARCEVPEPRSARGVREAG
jgi:hypothetical protein